MLYPGVMMKPKAPTARRVGLSREVIVERAAQLSEGRGIEGWSIRDIARSLDVVPSVIYHYFPHKDDLCAAVVETVCATVDVPDGSLNWKQWFTVLLARFRPVLLRYPGVTERLSVGEFGRAFLPIIDAACKKLMEAGFADLTPLAYSMIVNVAMSTISARHRRSPPGRSGQNGTAVVLERLNAMVGESEGLDYLVKNYFEPMSHQDREKRIGEEYYELVIASLLDGIEHVLLPRAAECDSKNAPNLQCRSSRTEV